MRIRWYDHHYDQYHDQYHDQCLLLVAFDWWNDLVVVVPVLCCHDVKKIKLKKKRSRGNKEQGQQPLNRSIHQKQQAEDTGHDTGHNGDHTNVYASPHFCVVHGILCISPSP